MKVWTCIEFGGRWPVPTAAVVWAATQEEAADLLQAELKSIGLEQVIMPNWMHEFTPEMGVSILSDGDY